MTIIESVRKYILECPFLDDLAKVNVNFLPKDSNNYSIEEMPSQNQNGNIVKTYIDGSTDREFNFVFACIFDYSEDLQTNIENSGFFENFQEWIEDNDLNEIYPKLKDGLKPYSIAVTTTGYLFYVPEKMDRAIYQIQLKLLYEKEGK